MTDDADWRERLEDRIAWDLVRSFESPWAEQMDEKYRRIAAAIVKDLGIEPAQCYFGPKKDHWKPSTLFYRIHCLDPDELV